MSFNYKNLKNNKEVLSEQHPFHLVDPSPWPLITSFLTLTLVLKFIKVLHFKKTSIMLPYYICNLGLHLYFCFLLIPVIRWFIDIIVESTYQGHHTYKVGLGLRMGMILFIVSEIMFFFSFFWAFFHYALTPSIWCGGVWPPKGIIAINPWGMPLSNTIILLSSGITVTWAHAAIVVGTNSEMKLTNKFYSPWINFVENLAEKFKLWVEKHPKILPLEGWNNAKNNFRDGLIATIFLGILFTYYQLEEYQTASFCMNDSVYGSIFYMATGFHGVHVLLGTTFLFAMLIRHFKGHFLKEKHFGFIAASWYWHFVDVVWLFLYIVVYIWGSWGAWLEI